MGKPSLFSMLAGIGVSLALAGTSHAAVFSFVSSDGSNANPCSRTEPCKSLQEGLNKVSGGGHVIILDSGSFGATVTVTKSVTISANGASASLGNMIINKANATVVLRGLVFSGRGETGDVDGIKVEAVDTLHVEDCVVERFPGDGIDAYTQTARLFIRGTVSRMNGDSGLRTGDFDPQSSLIVDQSRFEYNGGYGIIVAGLTKAVITRSIMSSNTFAGLYLDQAVANAAWSTTADSAGFGFSIGGQPSADAELTVTDSTSRGNGFHGLTIVTNSLGRIKGSVFTDNSTGISNAPVGGLRTFDDNTVAGNSSDFNGQTPVVITPQ